MKIQKYELKINLYSRATFDTLTGRVFETPDLNDTLEAKYLTDEALRQLSFAFE